MVYQGGDGRAHGGFWNLTRDGNQIRSCLEDVRYNGKTVAQHLATVGDGGDDYAVATLFGGSLRGDYRTVKCAKREGAFKTCIDGLVYFDRNCNRIPWAKAPANACDAGQALWRASPVSLNFAEHTTITEGMTFTQFPLIPGEAKKWFTWKASASHPLLVIDPQHTGVITSPYQLLGSWSLGGATRTLQTMLSVNELPPADAQPWTHGFDALATFDLDSNGSVDGKELEPLALWFDENRNGISESGEVKRMHEAGVTALFYRGAQHSSSLDGYLLNVGFERTVDGHRTQGSAFDWFSPGDTSKERLIAAELKRQSEVLTPESTNETTERFLPESKVDTTALINGSWEWASDPEQNPGEPSLGGILNILAFENGEIRGVTFSESHYEQPYELNSVVTFNSFSGTTNKADRIEFTVRNDQWTLTSTARLSKDGATLVGKTTATNADSQRSFSYTWTAKKKLQE